MAYICGDKPADPLRKLEYAVSCPPIVRTLVDSLFNVIFALEDLENRVTWYYKSGWREDYEKLERYMSEYGSVPEWKSWLETYPVAGGGRCHPNRAPPSERYYPRLRNGPGAKKGRASRVLLARREAREAK
jgi:hypothetical protein